MNSIAIFVAEFVPGVLEVGAQVAEKANESFDVCGVNVLLGEGNSCERGEDG